NFVQTGINWGNFTQNSKVTSCFFSQFGVILAVSSNICIFDCIFVDCGIVLSPTISTSNVFIENDTLFFGSTASFFFQRNSIFNVIIKNIVSSGALAAVQQTPTTITGIDIIDSVFMDNSSGFSLTNRNSVIKNNIV